MPPSCTKLPLPSKNTLRTPSRVLLSALRKFGNGSVAQSVEQGIENPRVGGSIPSRATSLQNKRRGPSLPQRLLVDAFAIHIIQRQGLFLGIGGFQQRFAIQIAAHVLRDAFLVRLGRC